MDYFLSNILKHSWHSFSLPAVALKLKHSVPSVCNHCLQGLEIHGLSVDIKSILCELVIYILLRYFPVAEVIQNVTGITHFDKA